ncbi:MAG: methyltransferase domain-containing protein [Vicinamibacterales bacterium]
MYVHGYEAREQRRLQDQADTLSELLHHDTSYPAGARVLEVGCGVGAQTVTLARNSPRARFTSIDVSPHSIAAAQETLARTGATNVEFRRADLFDLAFSDATFDHAFLCFVLEHLRRPLSALTAIRRVVRPGGTITVIEGDHGSAYFHPDDARAREAIDCLIRLQARAGGNALIGRQLYPLLLAAGLRRVRVSPRMVYVDASRPALVDGFTRRTFTAMIAGVRQDAVAARFMTPRAFDAGIRALERTTRADGAFCYTFFKAVARTTRARSAVTSDS